jgi:hypothetical protein
VYFRHHDDDRNEEHHDRNEDHHNDK